MRRLVAVFVSLFLAFSGLVVASPALAVDGEAKDVFAARVIAKSSNSRVLVTAFKIGDIVNRNSKSNWSKFNWFSELIF
jgi:hypothetical protein